MPEDTVSLIITTWIDTSTLHDNHLARRPPVDHAKRLPIVEMCIRSLCENAGYPYELIIVSNGNDEHNERMKLLAADLHPSHLILNETNIHLIPARRKGANVARGDWLAFFDDDYYGEPDWLKDGIAFAHELETNHGDCVASLFRGGHDKVFEDRVECTACCGAMLVRRWLYNKAGGYAKVHHEYRWHSLIPRLREAGRNFLMAYPPKGRMKIRHYGQGKDAF